ncbi:hypothetical protein A3H86_01825 [Candidatus Roizmanbacteria bacterium RIFCSPLOWO2_02_FULL_41_9]|uniref:Methionine gamma-lyase n=1 Tax=Candidatus Roizmanbacteria bacterium RIFCSPLOWO2_02_FULL_41_9 TaxID=1802077 RepID=A0A1F7JQQ6_9BACT|nr:MAG: hypothetical protein A3H86_01825 [Candidatus Roizmanbacteria bacterium RIFCSPLOWO2_02_FULL_41_9]
MRLSTNAIHKGLHFADPTYGSVAPPIYPTATFVFPTAKEGALRFAGKSKGMIYSRFTNPTVSALEMKLAAMEEAEMCIVTSSGMSAITLALLHNLKAGDSIVSHKVIYGGAYELIANILPRYGIKVHLIDFKNIQEIEKHIDKTTKVLYFESPSNPLLEVLDIKKITALAKKHHILSVFDNTFAPPPAQEPLKLGVDIIVYSLTKYHNGHSDIIGGAVVGSTKLLQLMYCHSFIFFGLTMSPFTAYLVSRGLATLNLRLPHQSASALTIAKFLEKHPKIARVYYPGLASHPQRALVRKQMNYNGGILAFELKGGYKAGEKMVNNVKLIHLAVSLGAVESLIEHPASMTHSELSPEQRKQSNIGEGLIRLSVGIEDVKDLIEDLTQALKKI